MPVFYVGVGGTGYSIGKKLQERVDRFFNTEDRARFAILAIDGETFYPDNPQARSGQFCATGGFVPVNFNRDSLAANGVDVSDWFPDVAKYRGPFGASGLGAKRQIGMLGLIHHFWLGQQPRIDQALGAAISRYQQAAAQLPPEPFIVLLGGSAAGATGSGMMLALSQLLKAKLRTMGVDAPHFHAVVLLAGTQHGKGGSQQQRDANCFGLLWERDFWSQNNPRQTGVTYRYPFFPERDLGQYYPRNQFDDVAIDLILLDGLSAEGKVLGSYRHYEQMAADSLFELYFGGRGEALAAPVVNLFAAIEQRQNSMNLSAGKAVLQYSLEQHTEDLARAIVTETLGSARMAPGALQQGRNHATVVFNAIEQHLIQPWSVQGDPGPELALVQQRVGHLVENDLLSQVSETIAAFRQTVHDLITRHLGEQQRFDFGTLANSIDEWMQENGGAQWFHLREFFRELKRLIDARAKQLTKDELEADRTLKIKRESFQAALDSLQKALDHPHLAFFRKGRRADLDSRASALLRAEHEAAATRADSQVMEHLLRGIRARYDLAVDTLGATVENWEDGKVISESEVNGRLGLVIEAGAAGSDSVAKALRRLKEREGAEAVANAVHSAVLRFFREDLLPTLGEPHAGLDEVTPALQQAWYRALHQRCIAAAASHVRPYLSQTVWQALRKDCPPGTDPYAYAVRRVTALKTAARPWVSFKGAPAVQSPIYFAAYNRAAWAEFCREVGRDGHQFSEFLKDCGFADATVSDETDLGEIVFREGEGGSPQCLVLYQLIGGFACSDLLNYGEWEFAARLKGVDSFIDVRVTPDVVSEDRQANRRLLFVLAIKMGVIEQRGGVYLFKGLPLGGMKGRPKTVLWFVKGEDPAILAVAEAVNERWRKESEPARAQLLEAIEGELVTARQNSQGELRETYSADLAAVEGARKAGAAASSTVV